MAGKQFLCNDFKGKMQNRQPFSLFVFAIQHGKPQTEPDARPKLVKLVDKAPAELGVGNVQQHETVFDPIQPR